MVCRRGVAGGWGKVFFSVPRKGGVRRLAGGGAGSNRTACARVSAHLTRSLQPAPGGGRQALHRAGALLSHTKTPACPPALAVQDLDEEQVLVARLLHHLRSDDPDTHFTILSVAHDQLLAGGPRRLRTTLPSLVFCGLALHRRLVTARAGAAGGGSAAGKKAESKKEAAAAAKKKEADEKEEEEDKKDGEKEDGEEGKEDGKAEEKKEEEKKEEPAPAPTAPAAPLTPPKASAGRPF